MQSKTSKDSQPAISIKTKPDIVIYSVIIPCYRSGPWLEALLDRVVSVMAAQGDPFEILLVNDASTDDTWAAIERIAGRNPCVRGIDLLFNAGQFRATICGLEHARGPFVITMDDDGQHPPEEIPVTDQDTPQSAGPGLRLRSLQAEAARPDPQPRDTVSKSSCTSGCMTSPVTSARPASAFSDAKWPWPFAPTAPPDRSSDH